MLRQRDIEIVTKGVRSMQVEKNKEKINLDKKIITLCRKL